MTFTPRAAWAETPDPVRTAVAEALGAPIVGHTDLHGGMSPGPAAGLRLADGRQVFVKAVSAEVRAHNHKMILQEAAILDALPTSVPAPRRLATVEYGPWAALATTWAPGITGTSWTDASIAAVANACRTACGHRAPGSLPPVAERIFDFNGWTRLLEIGASDDWEAPNWPSSSAWPARRSTARSSVPQPRGPWSGPLTPLGRTYLRPRLTSRPDRDEWVKVTAPLHTTPWSPIQATSEKPR